MQLKFHTITPDGWVSTLAGDGTQGYLDGPVAEAQFFRSEFIALDGAGNIFVSDLVNNVIRVIRAE